MDVSISTIYFFVYTFFVSFYGAVEHNEHVFFLCMLIFRAKYTFILLCINEKNILGNFFVSSLFNSWLAIKILLHLSQQPNKYFQWGRAWWLDEKLHIFQMYMGWNNGV